MTLTIKDLTDRKLKELYYNKLTYTEIATIHNCSSSQVGRRVKRLIEEGYLIKRPNHNKIILDEPHPFIKDEKIDMSEIIKLYNEGMGMKDIAKKYCCSYSVIVKRINEYKKKNEKITHKDEYPLYTKELVMDLYNNNIPLDKIVKILGISNYTLYNILKEALSSGKIVKREEIYKLSSRDLKVIELYRGHHSIQSISEEINKSLQFTDTIIKCLIEKGYMKRRNPSNKHNNVISMRNNSSKVINMYRNNISIRIIADYFEVTQSSVNLLLESILLNQDIEIIDSIYDRVKSKKIMIKELAGELDIPDVCIYKYLRYYKPQ